jgi:conjugal transfer pilus assembly protein TraW
VIGRRYSGASPLSRRLKCLTAYAVKKLPLFITAFVLFSLVAFGKTYEIAEHDALTEIEERANGYLINSDNETKQAVERFKADSGYPLSKAPDNYSYMVDITYTLDKDIAEVDIKGAVKRIFYAKGYTFNPLEYLKVLHPTYIVYNHCDKAEREYVTEYLKTRRAILLSSGCPISSLNPIGNHSVYPLPTDMAKLYKLRHTVSVISPNMTERRLQVHVIKVD